MDQNWKLKIMLAGWLAAVLMVGCNLNQKSPAFPPTLSPAPLVRPTLTTTPRPSPAIPPVATATQTQTTPIEQEGTAVSTPSGSEVRRVNFSPGATSAEVSGNLLEGSQVSYLVFAGKGQWMMLEVGSPNHDVTLAVTGVDGSVLVPASALLTTWQGALPYSGDYRITLIAPSKPSSYDLSITIPAIIQFSPGATSTIVQGQVTTSANVSYILYALGGQATSIAIKSANNQVLLILYGLTDGRSIVQFATGTTQWSGILPSTQYYMIVAATTGKEVPFVVQVSIK